MELFNIIIGLILISISINLFTYTINKGNEKKMNEMIFGIYLISSIILFIIGIISIFL